jgi:ubiquinone/menaquinone biosynthesis C-methylase UbiE
MNLQDEVNRGVWSKTTSTDWLARGQGFTDEGERHAYCTIMDQVRNAPILDIGVGPGRTIPMLRALTDRYVAIDYLPEMVELARQRYPQTDIRVGDARDLSSFDDASFSLVTFSFMGIDAVDHEGRQRILHEVARVLRPGGTFWFSTLNKDGPAPRDRPWRPNLPSPSAGRAMYVVELYQAIKGMPRDIANYNRLKGMSIDGHGWSTGPFAAHRFGLVAHYTTLPNQLAELIDAGFEAEPIVYGNGNGELIRPTDPLQAEHSFNILARKRLSTPTVPSTSQQSP